LLNRAGRAALSLRRTTQGAVSVRAPGRRSFLPASGTAPGFPSERPGDDHLSARQSSARFFSESRSGRDPFRRDDPTVSGWKIVFQAQRPASSRGEASRPTGGGRPRRCCADGRRRGEDAPPGVRRGFFRRRRRPGSPRARRSSIPSKRPGGDFPPVRSPAAGGFHPSAAATVLLSSDTRAPGVSQSGATAAIPVHPTAGRGGLRRRSRRGLVSGAGRRPIHPAADDRPSSGRTTARRPAMEADGPGLRRHGDGIGSRCLCRCLSLAVGIWL